MQQNILQKNQINFNDAFIFQSVQIIKGDLIGSKEKGKEKEISILTESSVSQANMNFLLFLLYFLIKSLS